MIRSKGYKDFTFQTKNNKFESDNTVYPVQLLGHMLRMHLITQELCNAAVLYRNCACMSVYNIRGNNNNNYLLK